MKLQASTPFRSTLSSGSKSKPAVKAVPKKSKDNSVAAEAPAAPLKKKRRPVEVEDDYEDEGRNGTSEIETPNNSRSLATALGGSLAVDVPKNYVVATMLDEGEDNEERYKNRRKNTALMVQPSKLNSQASQHEVRGLTTLFGQRADVILTLLETDSETDGALTLLQRTLLQTMVDVLPVVERAVRTSHGNRGVYQLNQCVSQIRELATDIQSLRSRGQLGASVVERVLRPAFLDLAVQLSLAVTRIDGSAKNYMSTTDHAAFRSEVLIDTQRGLATYVQKLYEEIKESVTSSLS